VIVGAGISSAGCALLFGITVVAAGSEGSLFRLPLLRAAFGCAICCLLAAYGRVRAGGIVALSAVWLQAHYALATLPDVPSPSLLASPALLVAATLLLPPRAARLFGIATTVMPWVAASFGAIGRSGGLTVEAVFWLVTQSVAMLVTWSIVTLGFSVLDRAFQRVRDEERALSETINTSPDGIVVSDADSTVRVPNPAAARLLGGPAAEWIGQPLARVIEAVRPPGMATQELYAALGDDVLLEISFHPYVVSFGELVSEVLEQDAFVGSGRGSHLALTWHPDVIVCRLHLPDDHRD
jgi:PAS domain-containing protein